TQVLKVKIHHLLQLPPDQHYASKHIFLYTTKASQSSDLDFTELLSFASEKIQESFESSNGYKPDLDLSDCTSESFQEMVFERSFGNYNFNKEALCIWAAEKTQLYCYDWKMKKVNPMKKSLLTSRLKRKPVQEFGSPTYFLCFEYAR
ncbi:14181_t:CDS:2, partial [Dentiscutata erythropus]